MTFTYSLISDMHLDHPQIKTPYDKLEDNVIVAGDTMNGLGGLKFLDKLRNKGFRVFAVDGNHEHYANVSQGRGISQTTERFQEDHPSRIDIDGNLSVLLINGWYVVPDPSAWMKYMNDGRYVEERNAHAVVNEFALSSAIWLRDQMSEDRKFIVVTHTSPCIETLDPRFEDHWANVFYYNPHMFDVMRDLKDKILVWNHGHTHQSQDRIVEGVRVVCNPRGYPRENPEWQPKTIIIESGKDRDVSETDKEPLRV